MKFVVPELEEIAKQTPYLGKWTPEMEQVLLNYYNRIPTEKIREYLLKHYNTDKTINAIQCKYAQLRRRV